MVLRFGKLRREVEGENAKWAEKGNTHPVRWTSKFYTEEVQVHRYGTIRATATQLVNWAFHHRSDQTCYSLKAAESCLWLRVPLEEDGWEDLGQRADRTWGWGTHGNGYLVPAMTPVGLVRGSHLSSSPFNPGITEIWIVCCFGISSLHTRAAVVLKAQCSETYSSIRIHNSVDQRTLSQTK